MWPARPVSKMLRNGPRKTCRVSLRGNHVALPAGSLNNVIGNWTNGHCPSGTQKHRDATVLHVRPTAQVHKEPPRFSKESTEKKKKRVERFEGYERGTSRLSSYLDSLFQTQFAIRFWAPDYDFLEIPCCEHRGLSSSFAASPRRAKCGELRGSYTAHKLIFRKTVLIAFSQRPSKILTRKALKKKRYDSSLWYLVGSVQELQKV